MDALRVVFLTPRFWPMVGGVETLIAGLGRALGQRGCRVTLLTNRANPVWPAEIQFEHISVARVGPVPKPGIDTICYIRAVTSYLAARRDRFDVVCASGLRYEAMAALRGAGRHKPVVLRAERAGPHGDCTWQQTVRFGSHFRRQCVKAAAIVAPWQGVADELAAAGYPAAKIHRIGNGVAIPPARSPQRRAAARALFAATQGALAVPDDAPVAVHVGRIDTGRGLGRLISAWARVCETRPRARLWLVGEERSTPDVRRAIEEANLSRRVMIVGSFDAMDEVLAAADLAIFPLYEPGTHTAVLEAMAAGLPIIAGGTPWGRELIENGHEGLLVDSQSPDEIAVAVNRFLDDPSLAAALGRAAQTRAAAQFSLAKMADEHLTLFEALVRVR